MFKEALATRYNQKHQKMINFDSTDIENEMIKQLFDYNSNVGIAFNFVKEKANKTRLSIAHLQLNSVTSINPYSCDLIFNL